MDFVLTAYLPEGRRSWVLQEGQTLIGRTPDNAVVLPDNSVSRLHACLLRRGDQLELTDLDSSNGTAVNDRPLNAAVLVRAGDLISIGSVQLQVYTSASAPEGLETPVERLEWGDVQSLPPPDHDATLGKLVELGGFLAARHTRDEIYETVLDRVHDLVGYQLACLFLRTESGLVEVQRRSTSSSADPVFSRSLLDKAVRERCSLLITDRIDLTASMVQQHIRSALAVPLLDSGRVLGVLYLDTRRRGRIYNEQDLRHVELLATTLALKLSHSDLLEEMERAECVQRSLLPAMLLAPPGYDVHARLDPCASVAGDLYDVLPLPDKRHAVVLGDVAGHGVGAALLMASVLATIRTLATQIDDPVRLGEQLCGCLGERGYVTMLFGILDWERHTLRYVNAGHPGAVLLLPDGSRRDLETTGPPVGMRIGVPFEGRTIELEPGTLLCAWSDGLHESHRSDGDPCEFFGEERLLALFTQLRNAPLGEFARTVFAEIDGFLGGSAATDDRLGSTTNFYGAISKYSAGGSSSIRYSNCCLNSGTESLAVSASLAIISGSSKSSRRKRIM
jgi:phosphoserine phosphatase RsbU/P